MADSQDILAFTETDMQQMLAADVHIGSKNMNYQMEPYIWSRRDDGVHLIHLGKTWQKLMLAARIIAAVENPKDVAVVSARPYGQRAILKMAHYLGVTAVAGRFTPGTFSNQSIPMFMEPRVLLTTDPRTDHQAVRESAYANIPVIAFCDSDAPLRYVDVCIPCNTKGKHAIGLMYWFLTREVLRMRGFIHRQEPWSCMVDMFFYRDPEEIERKEEEKAAAEAAAAAGTAALAGNFVEPTTEGLATDWGEAPANDWAAEAAAAPVDVPAVADPLAAPAVPAAPVESAWTGGEAAAGPWGGETHQGWGEGTA